MVRFLSQEIGRGSLASGVATGANALGQMTRSILIAAVLGAEGFGEFSIIVSLAAIIQLFFDIRINEFATRYGTLYLTQRNPTASKALIKLSYFLDAATGIIGFVVLTTLAGWLASEVARQPALTTELRLYALVLLTSTVDATSNAVLRIAAKYKWMAIYAGSMQAGEVIVVGIALIIRGDLCGVIVALIVKDAFSALTNVWLARRAMREINYGEASNGRSQILDLRPYWPEYRKFLFHTNLLGYSKLLMSKLDAIVLARYLGTTEVGLFRLAVSGMNVLGMAIDPVRHTLLQTLTRIQAQAVRKSIDIIRSALIGAGLLVVPGAIAMALLGEPIIALIAGETHPDLRSVVALLAVATMARALGLWAHPLLLTYGKTSYVGSLALVNLLLYPPLLWLLAVHYEMIGAAVALLSIITINEAYLAYRGWILLVQTSKAEQA